jgi:hypothetical protein
MNLEHQVASLAESLRMKELGFPQDTLFCWYGDALVARTSHADAERPAAPTVAEMGEWMPEGSLSQRAEPNVWLAAKSSTAAMIDYAGTTEAEARARLLIALAESGALDVKGLK